MGGKDVFGGRRFMEKTCQRIEASAFGEEGVVKKEAPRR
jgi:hypothetical protein